MKFKAGDKVERISEYLDYGMKVGTLWVVQGYQGSWLNLEGVLDKDGDYCCWDESNFKLYCGKGIQEGVKEDSNKLYSPLNVQQSGEHYKKQGIQPIEYGLANNLSFPQTNIVKYVTRHEDKNGIDDLAKSIHYHFFEALRVYGEEGSDELRNKVLKLLEMEELNEETE